MLKHAPTAIPTMARRANRSAPARTRCDIGLSLRLCRNQLRHFRPSKFRALYPLVVIPWHPESLVNLLILLGSLQYCPGPQ
jgi:hypothetical protein